LDNYLEEERKAARARLDDQLKQDEEVAKQLASEFELESEEELTIRPRPRVSCSQEPQWSSSATSTTFTPQPTTTISTSHLTNDNGSDFVMPRMLVMRVVGLYISSP